MSAEYVIILSCYMLYWSVVTRKVVWYYYSKYIYSYLIIKHQVFNHADFNYLLPYRLQSCFCNHYNNM